MNRSISVIVPLLVALLVSPAHAQTGEIESLITDSQTGQPLAGVQLSVDGLTVGGRSGEDGQVVLRGVPAGRQTLAAERVGYGRTSHVVQVRAGETTVLEIRLSQQAVTLSGITVVGQQAGYVSAAPSTAGNLDIPLIETPQAISVVSGAQLRDQASPNLQEALRYTPGVRHELYGVDNRGDWFGLRGGTESTTLLDGMRVPLSGWWGIVRTEPFAYDRIEVLRGPSSIIAGQNDPGGVVNLVSKRPQPVAAYEVGVRMGNFNRREFLGDATGPLNASRSLLYRLVAVGKESDTQIEFADEQRVLVAPSLTWQGSRGSVTGFVEYQFDESKNTNAFLGLAGTLRPAPNGPIPTDLFIGEPGWDTYGGTRWRFGYAAELELGGSWSVRHQVRHDRIDGLMKSMYAAWWLGFLSETGEPLENGRYMGREWYVYDDQAEITNGEILLQGELSTGPVRHRLAFGADGVLNLADQLSGAGTATPLNVYDPVYNVFSEPTFEDAARTETEIGMFGFLAQDQMKFSDRMSLQLGVRRDRVRNEIVGSDAVTDWATSLSAGVVFEVLPGLAPYASYSESFNPVAGTDARGEGFKPKRGEQVEAGVKWESTALPLQASAAVYSLKETNRLVSDPEDVNYSIQLGEGTVRGVELEGKSGFGDLRLTAGYTYTRARGTAAAWGGDLDPDQQLEGIPEHSASLWAVHDFARLFRVPGLSLGGGVRYVGRVGDGTGNVFVPAVTLLDAMASYQLRNWRLAVNANNLTDDAYIAGCLARGDCWFGPRRSVTGTLSFTW